ncbi:MAG: TetR/AcrR family transcriptional regulator [Sorangiineae bacterium]|nr:TetR/AcrR family transcriptional regulator [Sorangiineae bacterium]
MFTIVNVVHSPELGRRERRREERAGQILDVALRLIDEGGLEGLTVHRLAEELGYVPGALYRYFASKDALVAALQARMVAGLHARFRAAQAYPLPPNLDARARALVRLVRAARSYLALPRVAPEEFRLLALLAGDPRPLVSDDEAGRVAGPLLELLSEVSELFERAARRHALRHGDARDRTLVFWSSLHGACQLEKLARFDRASFDVARLGESVMTALLLGWGADGAALERAAREERRGGASC